VTSSPDTSFHPVVLKVGVMTRTIEKKMKRKKGGNEKQR
jgi:hypothetical protein